MSLTSSIPPDQEPKWADAPLPSPSFGPGGRATITVACTSFAASPATCLELMLDAASYPFWNRWIPRATVQKPADGVAGQELPAALQHLRRGGEDAAARAETLLLPGAEFQFEVHMNPSSATNPRVQRTNLVVVAVEEFVVASDGRRGLRVVWKTRGDPWYLRAERTQEFLARGTGGGEEEAESCDYSCYETFYGPVAPLVKFFAGDDLVRGFGMWMEDLRKAAEERQRGKTGGADAA